MLHIILSTFIYFLISFGFGSLINKLIKPTELLSLKLLNGILLIGIISLISSIFIPLNFGYELILITLGLVLSFYFKCWEVKFNITKSFLILVLITSLMGSMDSFLYDTYSYYLPTIKFIDDYGLLKGVANFDFNLGQTSLWHIIQGSTNNIFDFSYKINTFIIVIFLIYIYENNLKQYILFLPIFYLFVSSPSPDLPIFIGSIIIVSYYIKTNDLRVALFYSSFLILIKPIAFVLPLYFFILSIKLKSFLKVYFLIIFLALLFIVKSIILSGNPFFPIRLMKIDFVNYAVPDSIYNISNYIGWINGVENHKFFTYAYYKKLNYMNYVKLVFNQINLNVFLFLLEILMIGVLLIKQKCNSIINIKILGCLIALKILVFLYISIQYRFLIDCVIIVLILSVDNRNLNFRLNFIITIFLSLSIFFIPVIGKKYIYFYKFETNYHVSNLLLNKIKRPKSAPYVIGNMNLNIVYDNDLSSDLRQPVLNKKLLKMYLLQNMHPQFVSSSDISKGFILKENNDTIRMKLIFLINKINQYNKGKKMY